MIRLAAYKRTRVREGRQWEEEGNEPPNIFDKFTPMQIPNKRIFDLIRLAAYKRTRGGEGRQWEDQGNEPPNIFDKFTPMTSV